MSKVIKSCVPKHWTESCLLLACMHFNDLLRAEICKHMYLVFNALSTPKVLSGWQKFIKFKTQGIPRQQITEPQEQHQKPHDKLVHHMVETCISNQLWDLFFQIQQVSCLARCLWVAWQGVSVAQPGVAWPGVSWLPGQVSLNCLARYLSDAWPGVTGVGQPWNQTSQVTCVRLNQYTLYPKICHRISTYNGNHNPKLSNRMYECQLSNLSMSKKP